MVYFDVVYANNDAVRKKYCDDKEKFFSLVKKVNEFVANIDPYTKEYIKWATDRFERVKVAKDLWGKPYDARFVEGFTPEYQIGRSGRYELSERESKFVKEEINDECKFSVGSFRRAFRIPTVCDFNKDIVDKVFSNEGMDECAQMWKRKIDDAIPDFKDFKVEIAWEY